MMKKNVFAFTLAMVILVCGLCSTAFADGWVVYYLVSSKEAYMWSAPYKVTEDSYDLYEATIYHTQWPATWNIHHMISEIESSDPSIAKVKALSDGGFRLWVKKPGYADISYITNDTHEIIHIGAIKYKNPCKSLKIGKTEYAKQYKKSPYYVVYKKKLSGKISVKAAEGWKLVDIRQGGAKHLENGQKVSLKTKGTNLLYITFQKKGENYGCTLELSLQ